MTIKGNTDTNAKDDDMNTIQRMGRRAPETPLHLTQVLEVLPDAVMVIDTDFTVRLVNAAFTRLSGVESSKAIGKKCHNVFPGDICRTSACPMNRIREGVEKLRYEADKHCVCGRSAPGIMTTGAYRSSDGALAGMIEIVSDMTPLYESRERFRKAMGGVIQAMSRAIEMRCPYTAGHQRRVTKLCRAIAEEMGFSCVRTLSTRRLDLGLLAQQSEAVGCSME